MTSMNRATVPCLLLSSLVAGCQSDDPAPHASRVHASVRTAPTAHAVVDGASFDALATYDTLAVDLREVSAHGPEGWVALAVDVGWVTLMDGELLPEELVAEQDLPEGDYDAVRLVVDAAWVDGVEARVPSGAQSGVKVQDGFCLTGGEVVDLDLVIDLNDNVRVDGRGELFLHPVVHLDDPPGCAEPPDPETD